MKLLKLVMLATVILSANLCFGEKLSWTGWHGPNHNNISAEKNLLKDWPKEGPALIWKFDACGRGFSSVSLADGMIFTAGDIKNKTVITALDLNGKAIWTAQNGEGSMGKMLILKYPGSKSTPVYSEGMLYQLNGSGDLIALEAKTGKKVWGANLVKDFKGKAGNWGYAESVTIDGGNLLCTTGGSEALVIALDKKTGKKVWASEGIKDDASYCSGALITHKGKRQYLTMSAKNALGLDPATGKILWNFEHITKYDINPITPAYKDGFIYLTSGYGSADAMIKLSDDGASVSQVWSSKKLDCQLGGVVLAGGYIYGSGDTLKGWHCLDWKTGNEMWVNKGVGAGAALYADGMLYCLGENGQVALVETSPSSYKEHGTFSLPDGGDKSWNHPVILDGRLYLRRENNLYAYDIKWK